MTDQGSMEQQKAASRAVKPALLTLLLAGSAGIYATFQAGPTGNPEPAADPGNDAKDQTVAGQAPAAGAAVVPEFGKATPAAPVAAPVNEITSSLASAASSAAKSVKESVSDAFAAAIPEKRSGAIARIEFPEPKPAAKPAAVQRIVLPEPVPAAAVPVDLAVTAPNEAEAAPAAAAPAIAVDTAEQPATLAEPQAPIQRSEPAPALVVAPAIIPVEPAIAETSDERPEVVQAFADSSFVPLSEARLAGLRPIGGEAVAQAAPAPPPAKPRPVASLAPSRAAAASRPGASPKLAAQTPKANLVQPTPHQTGARGAATRSGLNGYRMVGNIIEFRMPVRVNGEQLGRLTMHIAPDDQISLHLKELVSMFEQQLDPQVVSALKASPAINEFVSFERLRAAGIDIRYDAARNQVILAADQS